MRTVNNPIGNVNKGDVWIVIRSTKRHFLIRYMLSWAVSLVQGWVEDGLSSTLHFNISHMSDMTYLSSDNGTYIYAETSSPRQPGDKAILVSQQIPANTRPGNCIIFWYHMYGAHVSVLNMYIQTGSGALPKPTWTRNGTQGNEWKKGMVFYTSTLPYKVRSCGVIRNGQC